MRPEDALAEARRRAGAAAREAPAPDAPESELPALPGPPGLPGLPELTATPAPAARAATPAPGARADAAAERRRELARWALIEPDRGAVYSTRRLGAPITAVKRLLVRMVRQYLDGATAQQSRFNAHLVAYALSLEDRIAALEARVRELDSRDP